FIKKSISDEMIKYKWIEKWDGKTPKATGTDSLLQLPLDDEEESK
ncbi:prohibitin family protein, partial [Bacillus atrophaeus]|nr:prohibitin family protein [Bacillus atrophaeus]